MELKTCNIWIVTLFLNSMNDRNKISSYGQLNSEGRIVEKLLLREAKN